MYPSPNTVCGTHLYVMAFTSGYSHAGSDDSPILYVYLNGQKRGHYVPLYDRAGDDMYPNKGDIWKYSISSLLDTTCISKGDIRSIAIHNGGNDGWNIESVMTVLRGSNYYAIVSADMDIYRWIDGDGSNYERQLDLHIV